MSVGGWSRTFQPAKLKWLCNYLPTLRQPITLDLTWTTIIYLFRTAVPATVRDIITMRLVKKAKVQKTRWVLAPKRALITWLMFSEWVNKDLRKAALKTASRAIGLWFQ